MDRLYYLYQIIGKADERTAGVNSIYKKVAVQCLNQSLRFNQSSCLVAIELLRNRQLLVAANHYPQPYNHKENVNLQYK